MALVKVSDSESPTTDDAMVPVEVSDQKSTSTEDLTDSMALVKVSDSESPPTGNPTAAGPSTISVGTASQPRSFLTLFQTLPPELREEVYFNLGYPIAFYIRHECNEQCLAYFQHQLALLRMNMDHKYERSGVPASWAEYKSTPKILDIDAVGMKFPGMKVYITGEDMNDDGSPLKMHMFPHQPELGLLMANRWFYNDIMNCSNPRVTM